MNAEIWTKAAQFPKKEYINGIFLSVRYTFTKPFLSFHKNIFLAVPPPLQLAHFVSGAFKISSSTYKEYLWAVTPANPECKAGTESLRL
jgi:hypothetical protein